MADHPSSRCVPKSTASTHRWEDVYHVSMPKWQSSCLPVLDRGKVTGDFTPVTASSENRQQNRANCDPLSRAVPVVQVQVHVPAGISRVDGGQAQSRRLVSAVNQAMQMPKRNLNESKMER